MPRYVDFCLALAKSLSRLGDSLTAGWYGVLDVLVALLALWPAWLLRWPAHWFIK